MKDITNQLRMAIVKQINNTLRQVYSSITSTFNGFFFSHVDEKNNLVTRLLNQL